ncbi:hypothetical protein [Flavobacterium psychrophilum]|uniref:hypothetical protein n=1 Tax=Flavobacterium psychrophilum TaxID=96345 RepID=UPI00141BAFC4|nr:hypothetical protein [Flavobacterium psychrophilum]MCB6098524.1 hypothetical protein [Flavobacterium psychrophilum]
MTKKTKQNAKFVFPRYFCHSDEGGITSSKRKTKRKLCLSNAGGITSSKPKTKRKLCLSNAGGNT